jgi:hypothetical protein
MDSRAGPAAPGTPRLKRLLPRFSLGVGPGIFNFLSTSFSRRPCLQGCGAESPLRTINFPGAAPDGDVPQSL